MFLQTPADNEATSSLFKSDLDGRGFVMNLTRLWAWRPEICTAFSELRTQLTDGSTLTAREQAVIVCATAAGLGDSYCSLAWGKKLAAASDAPTAAAVLSASAVEGLTAREQALAAWARKVAQEPNATTREDVEGLRAAGFSDREIFEATVFGAFRVAFSTINDALGVGPDWQLARDAPQEVTRAITFGRPIAERSV